MNHLLNTKKTARILLEAAQPLAIVHPFTLKWLRLQCCGGKYSWRRHARWWNVDSFMSAAFIRAFFCCDGQLNLRHVNILSSSVAPIYLLLHHSNAESNAEAWRGFLAALFPRGFSLCCAWKRVAIHVCLLHILLHYHEAPPITQLKCAPVKFDLIFEFNLFQVELTLKNGRARWFSLLLKVPSTRSVHRSAAVNARKIQWTKNGWRKHNQINEYLNSCNQWLQTMCGTERLLHWSDLIDRQTQKEPLNNGTCFAFYISQVPQR